MAYLKRNIQLMYGSIVHEVPIIVSHESILQGVWIFSLKGYASLNSSRTSFFCFVNISNSFYAISDLQVKKRTSNGNSAYGSHVMQYGDLPLSKDHIFLYMGTNPANDNFTFVNDNFLLQPPSKAVNQRDADLLHFWHKVCTFSVPCQTIL